MKLFLDDIRDPPDKSWVIARTYDKAIEILKYNYVDEISLDHDLGKVRSVHFKDGRIPTGYTLFKWIEEMCLTRGLPMPKIKAHSANPVGRKNIEAGVRSLERNLNWK